MKITRTYKSKTRTREIDVTDEQMAAWNEGALTQNAMPNLSDDDREFILTGMTPEDWDELFPEDGQ